MDRKKSNRDKIAFRLPPEPVDHVTIDRKAMFEIKDRANKIYLRMLKPNAVLCMFQALKEYIEKQGAKANFTVPFEEEN